MRIFLTIPMMLLGLSSLRAETWAITERQEPAKFAWAITERPMWVVTERTPKDIGGKPKGTTPESTANIGASSNPCSPACVCGCNAGFSCSCNDGSLFSKLGYDDVKKFGTPILIFFSTTNCPPCEKMKSTTLKQIPAGVIAIQGTIADRERFKITSFPTTVIVCCGWQWREVGYIDEAKLAQMIETAKAACKTGARAVGSNNNAALFSTLEFYPPVPTGKRLQFSARQIYCGPTG